jgi:hypothetical protein
MTNPTIQGVMVKGITYTTSWNAEVRRLVVKTREDVVPLLWIHVALKHNKRTRGCHCHLSKEGPSTGNCVTAHTTH